MALQQKMAVTVSGWDRDQATTVALALQIPMFQRLLVLALATEGRMAIEARSLAIKARECLLGLAGQHPVDAEWLRTAAVQFQVAMDADLERRGDQIRATHAHDERAAALRDARAAGTGHQDPLTHMAAVGTIGVRELDAAAEIRSVIASINAAGWEGCGALDLTRVRVDGGMGWSGLPAEYHGTHPAAAQVEAWAAGLGEVITGRRSECTKITLVLSVIVRGISNIEMDRLLGVRRHTSSRLVADALRQYVALTPD